MSDYKKNGIGAGDELDAILDEVRNRQSLLDSDVEAPSKTWSIDDIDRLIAETSGEEYVSPVNDESASSQDVESILDFDTELFTIRPMGEETRVTEMQDISSSSEDAEVDGQETFYSEEEIDESIFDIETVVVPEDEPEEEPRIFRYFRPVREEPADEKKEEKSVPEISVVDTDKKPASEIFRDIISEVAPQEEKKEEAPETDGHVAESEYRTRFFTKLNLERTADIDIEEGGPVDKPGIVVKKNGTPDEGGFEPVPRVLAAEDAEREFSEDKTRVLGGKSKPVSAMQREEAESDNVEGQIMLTGFEDISSESTPEEADEGDVEENLWERRRQKAKNFKLIDAIELDEDFEGDFGLSEEEKAREERIRKREQRRLALEREKQELANKVASREYNSPEEKTNFYTYLHNINDKATKGLLGAGIIGLIVVVLNVLPYIAQALSIETQAFAQGSVALNVMNAILLVAAAALNHKRFILGLTVLKSLRVTSDTAVSFSVLVAFIQNVVAAIAGASGNGATVFSAAAIFAVIITKITEKLDAQRILSNFEVCAFKYEHNMFAVHPFDNESEIFELGRGLMMGNADLLYSSQLSFPEGFINNSKSDAGESRIMKILLPAAAGAALISAIVAGVINKDFMAAFSAFAGTFCVCCPVLSAFIPAFISRSTNFTLNATGTVITGTDTAEQTAASNAVVIDCADIFDRQNCTMHGMKDFKTIRIDDVLLYAAALVIKSGGPLRESFEKVVDGRQDILPAVKELTYEDKLGIAARIHNQKVLLGNRNLLVNHNVDVPEKSLEERYSHSGRKVMYLAVAGKLAAVFVVSYAVDKNLGRYFKVLEDNGIQVLVRTNDVNVTQELIADSFELPRETFKILSATAGRLFKRRRDAVCDRLPAGIIHDGTAYSMLRAVAASCDISAKMRFASVVQIIISALGFILSLALHCTENGAFINGLTAVLFLALGLGISAGIMLLRKIK